MFFSSRAKVNILLPLISILALFSAFFQGQVTYAAGIAASTRSTSSSYQVAQGIAVKVATVDPMKLPVGQAQLASSASSYTLPHVSLYRTYGTGPVNVPRAVSVALESPNGPPPPPPPVQDFNGVSSSDSIKATGFNVQPPDQGLCVSKSFVVEPVNWAVTIYKHDGNGPIVKGPVSLQSFFNEPLPPKENISDPECYFDTTTNTWFAVLSAVGSGNNPTTHFDIAVNPSGDPTTVWTIYRLDTTDQQRSGCPCFGDQPRLGIDQYNIYIGTDEITVANSQLLDAQIYAISKSQLVALAARVNYAPFVNLSIAGGQAFAVQPAISTGNPNAEYFLSSFALASSGNQFGVWAITNGQAVTNGSLPTLSNLVINSLAYAQPPQATNPNGNSLASDDDRIQQVQFINGELWSSLDTAVTLSGDSTVRAGTAWFIVDPTLSSDGTKIQSASIRDQGALGSPGNYLLYPAIEASAKGTAVMVASLSGARNDPSAVYMERPAVKQGQFNLVLKFLDPGKNAYNCATSTGVTCRWGDYSAAVVDPANTGGAATFWIATEYIPDTGPEIPNWGTRIVEVLSS